MNQQMNLEEVREVLKTLSSETKIYLGCDSERYKKNNVWWSSYATVIVIHVDGRHGCQIFGQVDKERDLDNAPNKPILRLMSEVYRVSDLYLKLKDVLIDKEVEIHLDINPKENFASHIAYQQAIGYIRGVCQKEPVLKPNSFAASKVADRYPSL